jgi:hypothetical protein
MILYHISIDVPDIGAAMERLTDDLALSWRPLIEVPKVTLGSDGRTIDYVHRVVYSVEGPPALELCEMVPGATAPASEMFRIAHAGYWVEDLVGEWRRLRKRGWQPPLDSIGEDREPEGSALLRSADGLTIEIVDVTVDRPSVADLYPPDSPFYRVYDGGSRG